VAPAVLGEGDSLKVGVRPEKLRLTTSADHLQAGAGELNRLEGTVTDASYVGVSTQYVVRLDQGSDVVVYAQNLEISGVAQQHPVGQRVQVSWLPKHTFVIGASAPGSHKAGGRDVRPAN
jgi:spermidine/putrescine transport system ATP-binding protein